MALPDYEFGKHHIGLAPVGDTAKGYMITGYRREPQRLPAPTEFGASEDVLSTALSRWSMDDFSGGSYFENFKQDAAVFSRSQNMLPSLVENTARTVPPLVNLTFSGLAGGADECIAMLPTKNRTLALVFPEEIEIYSQEFGYVAPMGVFISLSGYTFQAAAHDAGENRIFVVMRKDSDGVHHLGYLADDDTVELVAAWGGLEPNPCRGLCVTAGNDMVTALNQSLWLIDMDDDLSAAAITRVSRLPGKWKDAVSYNGLVYILLTDREQTTSVVAWDGTQVLPVTSFPYNFLGECITSYGGRLYVGGRGKDISDNDRYAELYEITGASLRLVKTFSADVRAGIDAPKNFYSAAVHEGLLFLGTDGGLMAYDLTRDALWPNIQIYDQVGDRDLKARFLVSTREKLFTLCDDVNPDIGQDGFFRLATDDGDLQSYPDYDGLQVARPVEYESYIETSDFAPQPDREKRFSTLRLLSRYDPSPTLEYSLDGGSSWGSIEASASSSGNLRYTDFDLSGIPTCVSIRFRFTYTKDQVVAWSEQIAFTASFVMLDTGKTNWAFTVIGAEFPELEDASFPLQDVASIRTTLWDYYQEKTTLTFTDLDGEERTVFVSDFFDPQPVVTPVIDSAGTRESLYSITLTEI